MTILVIFIVKKLVSVHILSCVSILIMVGNSEF